MVHETAHAIPCEKRKDRDRPYCRVSLSGYYHRVECRTAARLLGPEVHFRNRRYGFAQTTWPTSGVPPKYCGAIELLGQFTIMASKGALAARCGGDQQTEGCAAPGLKMPPEIGRAHV